MSSSTATRKEDKKSESTNSATPPTASSTSTTTTTTTTTTIITPSTTPTGATPTTERDDGGDGTGEEQPEEDEAEVEEDEKELEEMKNKLAEIEEESKKLQAMQEQAEQNLHTTIDKEEIDSRSVFVGNVDYQTKPKELQEHFQACGTILRITILCDKWTGHPKGFAYVEFMDKSGVANAIELNESIFKGRPLKVVSKRTNVPVFTLRGRRRARRRIPRRRPRRGNYTYTPYY